jgi:hypothetical protein
MTTTSSSGAFRVWHLWPSLSVLTALTYNTWLLWEPLNGNARILNGYLSELSASDQPHGLVFRIGDLITAIIVLAMGIRAFWLWRRRHALAEQGHRPRPGRWWAVASAALLIFGVATFFDSFLAMDCSPTLSENCKVLEETGQLSAGHYAHTFTSVGAQVGIVASMIATYIAMVRSPRQSRTRRRVVLIISILEVGALTVMMIMLALDLPGLGYPQAIMVLVASGWFVAIGFRLVGDSDPPAVVDQRTETADVGLAGLRDLR